jgi:RHS repeat-associated protein
MGMPGRSVTFGGRSYRYGFNGKENDNEIKGEGNQQDYGMRIYDPRIGKFLSVDPITKDYPELTPYQFAHNTPIWGVDLDGLELMKAWENPDYMGMIYGKGTTTSTAWKVHSDVKKAQISFSPPPTIGPQKLDCAGCGQKRMNAYKLQKELEARTQLDPVAGNLAQSPLVQAGATFVAPPLALALGSFQTYQGVEEGDYVKAAFGALEVAGGVSGTFAKFAPKSSLTQLRSLEAEVSGAHFLSRHGAQTSLSSQYQRAISGLTPDGQVLSTVNSSRFLSHEMQLSAVQAVQAEFIRTGATSVTVDMGRIIGEGFIKGGGARSYRTTTEVQAFFKDGGLVTLFPKLRSY